MDEPQSTYSGCQRNPCPGLTRQREVRAARLPGGARGLADPVVQPFLRGQEAHVPGDGSASSTDWNKDREDEAMTDTGEAGTRCPRERWRAR